MEKDVFYEEMRKELEERLPEHIRREGKPVLREFCKNNDTVLHGILIPREHGGASPIVYVDKAYEMHRRGTPKEVVSEAITQAFCKEWEEALAEKIPSLEYENIRDKIFYRIVDRKTNRKKLSEMKYSLAECGFAKIYSIAVSETGSIPITNKLAENFSYDPQRIYDDAEKNTPKLFPESFKDIGEILKEFSFGKDMQTEQGMDMMAGDESGMMYILSNRSGANGAAALFYPGVKERIAKKLEDSYYVIPSSAHEVMIIPCRNGVTEENLENTLRELNPVVCSKAEVLSDRIMKYDKEREKLMTVDTSRKRYSERGN